MAKDIYEMEIYEAIRELKTQIMDLYCGDGDDAYDFDRLHAIGELLHAIDHKTNSLKCDMEYYKKMYLRNIEKLNKLGVMEES